MTSTRDIWSCQYFPLSSLPTSLLRCSFTLCSHRQTELLPSSAHPITQHPFSPLLSYFAQICSPLPLALLLHCDIKLMHVCAYFRSLGLVFTLSNFSLSFSLHFFCLLFPLVYIVVHVRGVTLSIISFHSHFLLLLLLRPLSLQQTRSNSVLLLVLTVFF